MNDKLMIPIMVKEGKVEKTWYMDVSNLGLSELLSLRENLKGTIGTSIVAIDKLISTEYVSDYGYNKLQNTFKRNDRRKKTRKKELTHKYHRR